MCTYLPLNDADTSVEFSYLDRPIVATPATCLLLTYPEQAAFGIVVPRVPIVAKGPGSRWARPDNEPTVIHFAPRLDHALLVDLRIGQVAVKVVGGPCFYKPLNRGSDYNEPASEPRIPRPTPTHCIPC